MHEKLQKAATWIILKQPFFASLFLDMDVVEDDSVDTAATDGETIYYSRDYVDTLSVKNCIFLTCHEVLHPLGLYFERMGEKIPELWNIAHDIVINQILVDEGIGEMPEIPGGEPVYDKEMHDACDGSAERIYERLLGKGDGTGSGHVSIDQPMLPKDVDKVIRDFRIRVVRATAVARKQGKMPGSLERFVEQIVSDKVDWRSVLRNFIEPYTSGCRTWARPNRRFAAGGVFAPGSEGEKIGKIVIAVDASGSVSDSDLAEFQGEINNLLEDLNVESMTVLVFDTKVRSEYEISNDDPLSIRTKAGGGTSYVDVMKRARELDAEGLVVLTDLYCDSYGRKPGCPVLWLTDSKNYNEPPFGSVTRF